uniref:Uncharacterized protein n=1 Tax=Pararge aegeria TaxID=116150 RepID=S4PC23_9NEOP
MSLTSGTKIWKSLLYVTKHIVYIPKFQFQSIVLTRYQEILLVFHFEYKRESGLDIRLLYTELRHVKCTYAHQFFFFLYLYNHFDLLSVCQLTDETMNQNVFYCSFIQKP